MERYFFNVGVFGHVFEFFAEAFWDYFDREALVFLEETCFEDDREELGLDELLAVASEC